MYNSGDYKKIVGRAHLFYEVGRTVGRRLGVAWSCCLYEECMWEIGSLVTLCKSQYLLFPGRENFSQEGCRG